MHSRGQDAQRPVRALLAEAKKSTSIHMEMQGDEEGRQVAVGRARDGEHSAVIVLSSCMSHVAK